MRHFELTVFCVASAFVSGACSRSEPEPEDVMDALPPMHQEGNPEKPQDIRAILASDARSVEDRARDAGRQPADVLEFLDIASGMSVIDLMATSGWYSEVLSHVVGVNGSVSAQNPPFILALRDGANAKALDERMRGNRLANLRRLDSTWTDLGTSGLQYDAALSALNLHDAFYLQSPEAAAGMLSAVYTILKPGGVFGVIDHVGNADEDNKTLHRLDKGIAIELAKAAGFVVESDSSLLGNIDDDHTQSVFAEEIRGRTDRFLLKLRKPMD